MSNFCYGRRLDHEIVVYLVIFRYCNCFFISFNIFKTPSKLKLYNQFINHSAQNSQSSLHLKYVNQFLTNKHKISGLSKINKYYYSYFFYEHAICWNNRKPKFKINFPSVFAGNQCVDKRICLRSQCLDSHTKSQIQLRDVLDFHI